MPLCPLAPSAESILKKNTILLNSVYKSILLSLPPYKRIAGDIVPGHCCWVGEGANHMELVGGVHPGDDCIELSNGDGAVHEETPVPLYQ